MYYPKSQIKTNLYTNGDMFFISPTGEAYIGYYHTISTNQHFTGKNPYDTPTLKLIPNPKPTEEDVDGVFLQNEIVVQNSSYENYSIPGVTEINLEYTSINHSLNANNRMKPISNSPLPNQSDYKLGEFERYYCKKNNELIYFEINQITFQNLKRQSQNIAFDLYTPIQIPWSLTGDQKQVYNTNKNITSLIEKNSKWYGFNLIFNENFSQYYLASEG